MLQEQHLGDPTAEGLPNAVVHAHRPSVANGIQHQAFAERLIDLGFTVPRYPLIDADVEDLDDWLAIHQIEHQAFATILDLDNPFNLLDADWNKEDDFYDWLASHLYIHEQIVSSLGL